jgi:hypothetical protein
MNEYVQIGMGGTLAVLVIGQVLSFLKTRKPNGAALKCPIEVSLLSGAITCGIENAMKPYFEKQVGLLTALQENTKGIASAQMKVIENQGHIENILGKISVKVGME